MSVDVPQFHPALGARIRGKPVVAGFPGPGLAGGIALEELFQALDPTPVAALRWESLAPHALVASGRASWPIVLADTGSVVLLKAETDVPGVLAHGFARGVLGALAEAGARELVVLEGLTVDLVSPPEGESKPEAWYVASDGGLAGRFAAADLKPLEDGVLGGVPGACLLWGPELGMPVGAIVGPTHPALPDPRAASALLAPLERLYGLPIDVAHLRERADELAEEFTRLARRLDGDSLEAGMYT
ncbi:MAG TPA: PAC2 family protein [Candidatus Thermoplasmatota archaeon]|nr:PAC2 family protein [Candidatus Thermoplasmatota archaeon]